MESKTVEVRNIQDIIDELQAHPDYVSMDLFTLSGAVEFLNDRIADEYFEGDMTDEQMAGLLIDEDDLSDDDKEKISTHIHYTLSCIWNNFDGSIYPELYEMEELNKKLERQSKLITILK